MIALDTNVLVPYLSGDVATPAEHARQPFNSITASRPGFICREVIVELTWVLERVYGYSRDQIATIVEDLLAREGLDVETDVDIARAADRFRRGGPDFCDLMIRFAAERSGAEPLYTFDRKAARLGGVTLLSNRQAS